MRIGRKLALGASLLALLVSACTTGGGSSTSPTGGSPATSKPKIVVGSADFYESALVAEIYAQALEAKGYTVERKLNVGARQATNAALKSGDLNLMPEYIGSEARELKATATGDPVATAANLKAALKPLGLTVLDIAPGQDQNGFVVRQETADQYSLKTVSDLAKVADKVKWGLPGECSTNPSCGPALKTAYGIDIGKLRVTKLDACSAAMATALSSSNIDVAELCTTQPDIEKFNLVLLEDDKQSQAADNMAPVVRQDLLDKAPSDFADTLNAISAKLTTDTLTKLGVKVAVDHQKPEDVAKQFLADSGLS
jgi:Periplasmic glycine betaine/choline-binding (lipo)protein of an ABC-type transport system (osmoprotectant binding protein)